MTEIVRKAVSDYLSVLPGFLYIIEECGSGRPCSVVSVHDTWEDAIRACDVSHEHWDVYGANCLSKEDVIDFFLTTHPGCLKPMASTREEAEHLFEKGRYEEEKCTYVCPKHSVQKGINHVEMLRDQLQKLPTWKQGAKTFTDSAEHEFRVRAPALLNEVSCIRRINREALQSELVRRYMGK